MLMGLLITVLFVSCDREDRDFGEAAEVTEEEALEMVQTSLMSEVYGMDIQADDALGLETDTTGKSVYDCGVLNSRSMERNSLPNAPISFTHSFDYLFSLVCEEGEGKAFAIEFNGNGTYSSARLRSDDTIRYEAVLANIVTPGSPYVYTSSFTREGTQVTTIAGRTKNFDSTLSIESTAITIDKASRKIMSGSSTFSFSGTLSTGEPFSYGGTVSFKGNGAATVTINGNSYNVQI